MNHPPRHPALPQCNAAATDQGTNDPNHGQRTTDNRQVPTHEGRDSVRSRTLDGPADADNAAIELGGSGGEGGGFGGRRGDAGSSRTSMTGPFSGPYLPKTGHYYLPTSRRQ
jgi:hypothetical protein